MVMSKPAWYCKQPPPYPKKREKKKFNEYKTHFQIRSCFSCVCFLLLASFLSVFYETLSCLEAAGKVIPDLPLCLCGPVWLQAPLHRSLWCSSRRQGWGARRGLKSECGTGESRRTKLWWPCAAAGCSFSQVDCRLRLQTNRLISCKDHDHLTLCALIHKDNSKPFPAPLCLFSLSRLLRAETSACSVSTRRSLSSTFRHAFCPEGKKTGCEVVRYNSKVQHLF